MTLTEKLAEIEKRAEEATPGEWFVVRAKPGEVGPTHITISPDDKYTGEICTIYLNPDGKIGNPEFIAHSRQDIPLLLKLVKRMEKALGDIVCNEGMSIQSYANRAELAVDKAIADCEALLKEHEG